MKRVLIIAIAIFSFGLTSCLKDKPKSAEVRLVSAKEMQVILQEEDVQLLDVRTKEEHEEEHIANSQNIDFRSPTFDTDVQELDKSKPVLLYCKSGRRSAECAKKLKDAGFEKIYELEGGISKWKHSEDLQINRNSPVKTQS